MEAAQIITTIAAVIKAAVDLTPTVIKGIEDAEPFAKAIYNNLFQGQEITPEQLAALEAQITMLSAQLQQPLPPEEDGA